MRVKIIPFLSKHATAFKNLNLNWLNQHFYVEEKDKQLLHNCQESILDIGGHIFLAERDDKIVGCFSLIPSSKGWYELGKMAVAPEYQGMRIGQQLLTFAITFAKTEKWKGILLYSSTKLDTALYIYRKYGFVQVSLEKALPYSRSDIKMELDLS